MFPNGYFPNAYFPHVYFPPISPSGSKGHGKGYGAKLLAAEMNRYLAEREARGLRSIAAQEAVRANVSVLQKMDEIVAKKQIEAAIYTVLLVEL